MSFCTVINCMDGRVQLPVIRFLKERFDAQYVDSVTEPGPNGIIAGAADSKTVDSIMARVDISVHRHKSVGIAVAGHHDCAGNPSPKESQLEQIRISVESLRSRYDNIPVIGLWVDENWAVHELPGK